MTATITPLPGIPALARINPELRLQDYHAALNYYTTLLGSCFDAIVFAENSDSDVSSLVGAVDSSGLNGKIEFISCYGIDYPPAYGRGYGEFRLIDYAMDNSKLILENDVIWKVTGRYIIGNMSRIIKSRPPTADIYCHMRNYPYRLCELYLLAWNRRGYENIIRGSYHKLRNDLIPGTHTNEEASFRKQVDGAIERVNVVPRFKVVPIVRGARGWDNSQFSNAWSLKIMARRLSHILIPSLWI